jgi:AcrR family transcriptional regulator
VFAEKSYSGATTNKIAARAGVSIGSLYQYFPNKDAILVALMEQHLSEVRTVVERSMIEMQDVTVPIHQALSSLLRGLMDLHDANPNLTRALSEDVVERYLADATPREMEESFTRETERLLRRRPDVRSGDYTVMADVLVRTTEDLTRWLVHKTRAKKDRRAYLEEVLRLLTRYVHAPPFRAAGREESRHAGAKSDGGGARESGRSARARSEGRERAEELSDH